ncbi:MAG: transglutaminase family protein [Candidatus Cryosericum sp.]
MRGSLDIRRTLALLLGITACGFLGIVEPRYLLYGVMFVLALPLVGHVRGRWTRRLLEAVPLAWFLVLVVLGTQLFALLAQAMLMAMACRFVLTDDTRDYQGLVLISVFITVLSAAGSISMAFGLLLLVQFLTASVLLVVAQFKGPVPHIGRGFYTTMVVAALVSFVFAFGVFFALPRWTLGYIKGSPALVAQTTGFSKDVTITPGQVVQDNTIVMRIEPQQRGRRLALPAYISGMRYTTFSGRQWLVAPGRRESLYASSGVDTFAVADGQADTQTTVYLEPTGTDVLFGLEHITNIRGQFQYLRRDAEGSLFTDAPYFKTIRYDVSSVSGDTVPADALLVRKPALQAEYVQVPELSPEFRDIAVRVVHGQTIRDKAEAARSYLLANYIYSLDPTAVSVEDFVVNRRTGYCEHFATAMVLLLRAEGVPARLVSGFVATEWNNASGYLIVRAKDAHTWVEVLDGDTWVRYDPTPGSFQQVSLITNFLDNVRMAWYRNVITYDLSRQVQTMTSVGAFFSAGGRTLTRVLDGARAAMLYVIRDWRILASIAATVVLVMLLMRRRRDQAGDRFATAIEDLLGAHRMPGETLVELAHRVDAPFPILELIWRLYRLHFAAEAAGTDTERDLARAIRTLRRTRATKTSQL